MLNPEQERAVKHFGKPLLVVAGAGSGKTKTLAHKVEFLVKEKGIDPARILAITFTNKAGKEIFDRVKAVAGVELSWVGTFHSTGLKLIREESKYLGIRPNVAVFEGQERTSLLKRLAKGANLNLPEFEDYIARRIEDLQPPGAKFENLFQQYLKTLHELNVLDFTFIMYYVHKLVTSKKIDKFDFVLIDEFQDTNTIQYEIVKALEKQNVCVVGDPNQCIYEWRYARPENILRFNTDFNPDVIKLERNYRSVPAVIYIANAVLSESQAQWKDLIPVLKPTKSGEQKPVLVAFNKEDEEALYIASQIENLRASTELNDIAILVRTSFVTDSIERALQSKKIPYRVVGTVKFFERAEVKDVLCFFKLLTNPYDKVSLERAIKIATRGIGEKTIESILKIGGENAIAGCKLAINTLDEYKAKEMEQFLRSLSYLYQGLNNYNERIVRFLGMIDFDGYLQRTYKDYEDRLDNVKELLKYLNQKHSEGYTIQEVLSEVGFSEEDEESAKAVKIMTIHASKGLEFKVVFLPRLEEGILPHEKSMRFNKIEEELRLFYVAVTRAREILYMTYCKNSKQSRFLSYIPRQLINMQAQSASAPRTHLKIGDLVSHQLFGQGKVLGIEGEKITVEFKVGKKTIHHAFLKKI
ncbi:MAG: ATP-dependent helicase [Aquificaceae bacterium]|nr:ATP-dependent helicase [Aquificaceae bacterium]MDW8236912.1 ATP-dependent helicase [Aquificaceae bacterium]